MKTIITISILALTLGLNAQDTIVLTNGFKLSAKVIEERSNSITYKPYTNLNGPLLSVDKAETHLIKYEDGSQLVLTPSVLPNAIDNSIQDSPFRSKYNGPRLGFTYLSPGTSADYISDKGKQPFISQFGWQFETRFFKTPDGLSGLVEFVPMIGGMEQGMFLPSASLLIGLRSEKKHCFEFGLGPNVSRSGLGMVFAAGTSFHSGDVYFPVNLSVIPSVGSTKDVYHEDGTFTKVKTSTGIKVSLTVGFNSRKK